MTRVYYMVGRDGYETRCNTYESALKQAAADTHFCIRTCYEEIEGDRPHLTPLRKAMLEQFGYATETLKSKVAIN